MDLCLSIKGVSFLLQAGLGILGNVLVLLAYAQTVCLEPHLLPVDIILCHLAFTNLMLLLTRCVPQTMTVFGIHNLLNDAGCKVVIYSYRIARALSVCITCMLSVFQAVMLAPARPCWVRLKTRLPSLVIPTFAVLWFINIAVCIAAPLFSIAPQNGTVPAFTLNLGFCYVDFRDNLSYVINGIAVSGRDFVFVGLMLGSSGYILVILHHHTQKARTVRRSQAGAAMETRAAKTVIILVTLYTVFFGIDNIIWIYMLTVDQVPPVVADMRVWFSSCYACLSPFLIMTSNKKVKSRMMCAAGIHQEQSTVNTQVSRKIDG